MSSDPGYWFPAKRYGWGWGVPSRWQGWGVLVVYFALLGAAALRMRPDREPFSFVVVAAVLTVFLIGVCWLKGEPPRWRWGED